MLKKFMHKGRINQLYATLHQLLMAGYGFLLLFVMVRLMPQMEVSRWILFISAISISDMLVQGLLQTIVVKKVSDAVDNILLLKKIQTNAFVLAILLVLAISVIALIACFYTRQLGHRFILLNDFSNWYPLMGLLMIIYNISWWMNIGKSNFRIILIQRIIFCVISFMIIGLCLLLKKQLNFQIIMLSQLAGYLISALFAYFVNRFDFNKKYLEVNMLKEFLGYGKYTIGTMLGSSLLRNSDTFMIAAFMNNSAVAIYTLAQKIIEIFEVILRSTASTFLPVLQGYKYNRELFTSKLFYRMLYTSLLFIPFAVITFLFSDNVIALISGSDQYGLSSAILKVFMVYVILLPADRLIGVALEAFNQPQLNLIKTTLLITVNIIGNFIALNYYNSLLGIAMVSSLALFIGILIGLYFLNRNGIGFMPLIRMPLKNLHLKSSLK